MFARGVITLPAHCEISNEQLRLMRANIIIVRPPTVKNSHSQEI